MQRQRRVSNRSPVEHHSNMQVACDSERAHGHLERVRVVGYIPLSAPDDESCRIALLPGRGWTRRRGGGGGAAVEHLYAQCRRWADGAGRPCGR